MKHSKKLLCLCLLLFAAIVLLPRLSTPASAKVHSGSCGQGLSWSVDTETGLLTISGNGELDSYIYQFDVYPPWYAFRHDIREAVIEEGVTFIGTEVFMDCDNLIRVSIPSTVEEFLLPFATGCEKLSYFHVSEESPYFSGDQQGALYNKNKTELLSCPEGYSGSFVVPKSVQVIGELAFGDCINLTQISLPNGVTSIGDYAFNYCYALTSVSIPNSVTSIGYGAFICCESLKSLSIPSSVSLLQGNTIYGCNALENLRIGASTVEIEAISYCASLTELTIEDSVKTLTAGFIRGCSNLKKITVSPGSKNYANDEHGVLYSKDRSKLLRCPDAYSGMFVVPHGTLHIASDAFYACNELTSVIIPDSIKTVGYLTFGACEKLSRIILPKNLEAFDFGAFAECTNLKKIYFRGPAPTPERLEEILDSPRKISLTLYYVEGQTGWTTPRWNGYRTNTWSGILATDVKEQDYFYTPVQWAIGEGITTGAGKDLFLPEDTCTRGQVVTFLWRAAGCPEPASKNNPFTDVSSKAYYYKAVLWAVEQNITKGMSKDRFSPNDGCTRAQVATFLWRAAGKPRSATTRSPFVDVALNTYYSQAVLWAVEQGITNGMGKDIFVPDGLCTRGQIVTFLWRAEGKPQIDDESTYLASYRPLLEKKLQEVQAKDTIGEGLLYDLDQDGTEELLLMYYDYQSEYTTASFCDVYTIREGKVVPLMEKHLLCYNVGGNQSFSGVLMWDDKEYYYCVSQLYEPGNSTTLSSTHWELYSMVDGVLTCEYDIRHEYVEDYSGDETVIIPEASFFTINGEHMPFEDYSSWCDTLTALAHLEGYSYEGSEYEGYSLEDLLNICS